MRAAVLAVVMFSALLTALPAGAHDSWFHISQPGQAPLLTLGTGQHYPKQETAIAPEYLDRQGCRPANEPGGEQNMRLLGYEGSHALRLQAAPGARSCWAQLVPLDVEVATHLVDVYLKEIRAGASTLAAWQTQRRLGQPWRERYTKHARIDLGDGTAGSAPVPMDMDLVRRAGGQLQVLRDGRPLAGQAVELLGDAVPFSVWRRSDEAGMLNLGPLPPGQWLARAVDLRPRADVPGEWDSRFVTLAFEIKAQAGETAPRGPPG
jgi:hypothetical protein